MYVLFRKRYKMLTLAVVGEYSVQKELGSNTTRCRCLQLVRLHCEEVTYRRSIRHSESHLPGLLHTRKLPFRQNPCDASGGNIMRRVAMLVTAMARF